MSDLVPVGRGGGAAALIAALLGWVLLGGVGAGAADWGFRIRWGGFPEPVWVASDLQVLVRSVQKDMENALKDLERTGRILQPPPVGESFPHWSRCQEIGRVARPDLLLVRMNLAGVKAAMGMLKGDWPQRDEDRLDEGLPAGFSSADWGQEILRDYRLRGRSKEQRLRILGRQAGMLRDLFTDVRDDIARDVVWAHNAWEKVRAHPDPMVRSPAAWRLWQAMGFPRRW
ncbi:MAG: hypothetical protein GX442_04085 [Candidatus Riflebacteria bacterium]|nr:hypothetical protein [Candidatus Riflebacteria bacterium]